MVKAKAKATAVTKKTPVNTWGPTKDSNGKFWFEYVGPAVMKNAEQISANIRKNAEQISANIRANADRVGDNMKARLNKNLSK